MDKKELAYTRQAVTAVKDWDIFQAIIRNYRKLRYSAIGPAVAGVSRKG